MWYSRIKGDIQIMAKTLRSYSKPLALGHRFLDDLFIDEEVVVQVKIDGSQLSWGKRNGKVFARSRNNELVMSLDEGGMFRLGVQTMLELKDLLVDGYTYRGEFLSKPKHNSIKYSRVPTKNIMLFDVDKGDQDYMNPEELKLEAERLGLESTMSWTISVEELKSKGVTTFLDGLLKTECVLGSEYVEGLVIKNYKRINADSKIVMGKYVSEKFKETHTKDWKLRNPNNNDILIKIVEMLKTEARWDKAIQHLAEDGELNFEPQDIPKLMKEVSVDILSDSKEEILEILFKHFWPKISKQLIRGLPEYYKKYLAEREN